MLKMLGFYPVSKTSTKWRRDLAKDEIEKCSNDFRVLKVQIVFLVVSRDYKILKENLKRLMNKVIKKFGR